jgi:gamma-glutamyltranspeptidase
VAVPGELHGLWTAFKRFGSGKIAWMDLLLPTVSLLNEGANNLQHNKIIKKLKLN